MSQTLKEKLGIWGNNSCVKCGACCYDYNHNSLCRYQEIRQGKSYCKMHDNPDRDKLCQVWFCSCLNDSSISAPPSDIRESLQQRLIEIAIELGTEPKNDQK